MLRIKNNEGVEVCVKFYHGEVQGAYLDTKGVPVGRRYCSVVADIDGHIVGQAEAVCHPLDPYVKKTGRKIAFQKLLDYMDLTRSVRREAWERFWAYGRPQTVAA